MNKTENNEWLAMNHPELFNIRAKRKALEDKLQELQEEIDYQVGFAS